GDEPPGGGGIKRDPTGRLMATSARRWRPPEDGHAVSPVGSGRRLTGRIRCGGIRPLSFHRRRLRNAGVASGHPTRRGDAMAFELPPLPYDYAALEPHIDEQ